MDFIFMLTNKDKTIEDAEKVYKECVKSKLKYIGFKDIGIGFNRLKDLCKEMHNNGHLVMLEVVSNTKEEELKSIRAAIDLGVDYVLGGTNPEEGVKLLDGSGIKYYPFPGNVVGHPSILLGPMEDIVESAKIRAKLKGVDGLDLLAYRFNGNVVELTKQVVSASGVPVIAAGSIDTVERIKALKSTGVTAFTVGSAIFEGKFGEEGSISKQINTILGLCN